MHRFALLVTIALLTAAPAAASNIAPLAFGMTAEETASALGAPLVYLRGRPGAEIFVAERPAGVPGFYPVGERFSLQFRRGRLAGWKRQWQLERPFLF